MQFAYTILYVTDVAKSILFYEKAFGLERTFIAPDETYGEMKTGTTKLAFAAIPFVLKSLPDSFLSSDLKKKPFGIEIGFATENVEADFEKALAAGAVSVVKPMEKPWGQKVAYVRDLDGFLIELCTPMGG